MNFSIVVAMAKNRVIGKDNKIPWDLPEDRRHFRDLTKGRTVIMGRKTHESIGGPLKGRVNLIITRQEKFPPKPGCWAVHSLPEAIATTRMFMLPSDEPVFCIGGTEIYKLFLPLTSRIYATIIDKDFPGDAFFPELDCDEWQETERLNSVSKDGLKFNFVTLVKKQYPAV